MSDEMTELRAKLTERGIEYTTNDHMGVCETSWNGFTAMQLTPSAKLIMAVTPEQAIAATLGRGTLTAEDVRSFLNRNSVFDDTTWTHGRQELVFDEDDLQAMADELNAELGRGTCRIEHRGMGYYCSECGEEVGSDDQESELYIYANAIELWSHCPRCGAVVSA